MPRGGIDGPADKGLQGSWSGAPWRRSAAVPGRKRVASARAAHRRRWSGGWGRVGELSLPCLPPSTAGRLPGQEPSEQPPPLFPQKGPCGLVQTQTLTTRPSLVAQLVKNLPAMRESWVRSLGWENSPGERNGYPLQYSGLENSMDSIIHGVAKSRTRLSDFHSHSPQMYWLRRLFELSNAFPYSSTSAASFNLVSEFGISCILCTFVP